VRREQVLAVAALGRIRRVAGDADGQEALAKFREHKLIRVAGRTITITQPLKLDKLLRQHLGEL